MILNHRAAIEFLLDENAEVESTATPSAASTPCCHATCCPIPAPRGGYA